MVVSSVDRAATACTARPRDTERLVSMQLQSTPKRVRKTAPSTCQRCGATYQRRCDSQQRFCSQLCGTRHRALSLRGENHPTYKGRVKSRKWVRVWKPGHPLAQRDGYVPEHRLVLYEAGIEIPLGSHVHHLNGDGADNRLENLEIVSASRHLRGHIERVGSITNQYGTWPLLTPTQREKKRRYGVRSKYVSAKGEKAT